MRYVIWHEPYSMEPLTNVECKMSFEDVVKAQRATYKDHPKTKDLSDEEIFMDFVVVHWGQIKEEKENEPNCNAME